MSVINNGDETATYGIKVEYKSKPDRLVPGRDWFTFSPDKFVIEPGKAQMVNVKMTVPIKAVPGDYFCFLSAFPIQGSTPGSTAVGIAVASKLFFTIAPSNIFVGIYYRVASLIVRYAPWTYIVFGVIILAIFLKFVGRFISVDIGIKKKK
jgi:hypothetical protein